MEQDSKEKMPDSSKTPLVSGAWKIPRGADGCHTSTDKSFLSSSLLAISHGKSTFADSNSCCSACDSSPNLTKLDIGEEEKDLIEDVGLNATQNFLPEDEDELLARIMDEFDLIGLLNESDDVEECDLFGSVGGMELDVEPQEAFSVGMDKMNISDGGAAGGFGHRPFPNSAGRVSVEHPLGEHPSRTLFVRNINSSVEDVELRSLFEPYGEIRSLYTACKHRGFVMISYYDIRSARAAMRALQNRPVRKRRLDIHFSIPKDNPSEKDINQGTLVIFNLDASASKDDLLQIFGDYGEIKEIRETPQKRHHRFIEYYDVRDAEAALKALNGSEIGGKRIKLEPSRPGGARRPPIPIPSQELERDGAQIFLNQAGSPVANSPPGILARSPVERKPLHVFGKSPASVLPPQRSSSSQILPIGKDQWRPTLANQIFANRESMPSHANHRFGDRELIHRSAYLESHSFPEQAHLQSHSLQEQKLRTFRSPMSAFVESHSSLFGTWSSPQFPMGSSTLYPENASSAGSTSSLRHPFSSVGQGLPYAGRHGSWLRTPQDHVGSAPSQLHLGRHLGYLPESPETSVMRSVGLGGTGINHSKKNYMMITDATVYVNSGVLRPGNGSGNGFTGSGILPISRAPLSWNGSHTGLRPADSEGFVERGKGQELETSGNQTIKNSEQHHYEEASLV